MERILGLDYKTNNNGQILSASFDFSKINNHKVTEIIEDLIDGMEAEAVMKEGNYFPLNEVLERQNKKRGINV